MSEYLENFLDKYYTHIEDYEALVFLLYLFPSPYQYTFTTNLLKYKGFLVDGDVQEGRKVEGLIKIRNNKIILVHDDFPELFGKEHVVLLEFPPTHEI